MGWYKLAGEGAFHAKVIEAGNEAYGAWCRAGQWSAEHLTDGLIPRGVALTIAPAEVWQRLVEARAGHEHGLAEVTPNGWAIHDYLDWNPTAEEEKAKRAADRDRKAAGRKAQGRGPDGRVTSARNPDGRRAESENNPPVPSPSPIPDQRTMISPGGLDQGPGTTARAEPPPSPAREVRRPAAGRIRVADVAPTPPDAIPATHSRPRREEPPHEPAAARGRDDDRDFGRPDAVVAAILAELLAAGPVLKPVATQGIAEVLAAQVLGEGYVGRLAVADVCLGVRQAADVETARVAADGELPKSPGDLAKFVAACVRKMVPGEAAKAAPAARSALADGIPRRFAELWGKWCSKVYLVTRADIEAATALAAWVEAQVRAAPWTTPDKLIDHMIRAFLADADPFLVDKGRPLALLPSRLAGYALPPRPTPKPPSGGPPDEAPQDPAKDAADRAIAREMMAQKGLSAPGPAKVQTPPERAVAGGA